MSGVKLIDVAEALRANTVPGGPEGTCWVWMGARGAQGYGTSQEVGGTRRAHRAMMIACGHDVAGKLVCHRCDNPPCINPDHLFVGTHRDNNHDAIQKGRARHALGVAHGSAKIDEAAVRDIRKRALKNREYAARYGITMRSVKMIAARRTWKHVP